MDKQNGHLTYLKYDEKDTNHEMYDYIKYDIEERIEHIKKIVQLSEPPKFCAEYLEDGKSGNLKLATICSYCPYKKECHPDLRTFIYSSGPRYLVKVVNTPKVPEVGSNGDF
jgi:hypothetical protein